jgi:exonuclease III
MTAKAAHWQAILSHARQYLDRSVVIVGDFNTGRRYQDARPTGRAGRRGAGADGNSRWASVHGCEALLGSLLSLGFVDAWRCLHREAREYSWVSHDGQPRRIDTAYLSPALAPALQTAAYSHVERRRRLSDHAPLVVDLALARTAPVSSPSSFNSRPGSFRHPAAPGTAGLFS